jgi:tetratricopeptide (TPR) repeat protein
MWDRDSPTMQTVLTRHDSIIAECVEAHGGQVLQERGEGDSFFAVFARASEAVRAAVACQLALSKEPWPEGWEVRVRMGLHSGEPLKGYRGGPVNRAARIRGLAHGSQILASSSVVSLAQDELDDITFEDLGEVRLRGLTRPERIFQVLSPGLLSDFPPLQVEDERQRRLPSRRRPSFVGREDVLRRLRRVLERADSTAPIVALTGTGGIGKTAAAREFAERAASDMKVVWWIDASTEASAIEGLTMLARSLDLELPLGEEEPPIIPQVHDWLASHEGWLLVFDSAPDPLSVERLLPSDGLGLVLITSRHADWSRLGTSVELQGLDDSDGANLLRRTWESEDEALLRELSSQLGGLPLALWQAVSYGKLAGVTARRYLELLQHQVTALLNRGAVPTDYSLRAEAIVSLAAEEVATKSPLALWSLSILSYLDSSPVPEIVFEAMSHPERFGRPSGGPSEIELLDARAILRSSGLLDQDEDGRISVHPVVAAVMRSFFDSEDAGEERHPLHVALHLIDMTLTRSGEIWRIMEPIGLLQHAVAVCNSAAARRVALDEVYGLLLPVANYLRLLGDRTAATRGYRRLVEIAEEGFGAGSVEHAAAQNNLAVLLQAEGELGAAEELLRQAVDNTRAAGPQASRELAVQLGNLGLLLADQGQTRAALDRVEESLTVSRELDAEDQAVSLAKKARIFISDGQIERGIRLFEEARQKLREVSDVYLDHVLFVLEGSAHSLVEAGRLNEAKQILELAVERAGSALGEEAPTVHAFVLKLLDVLLRARDWDGLRVWLDRAAGLTVSWQD